jgi:SAM-dependent methyltransferase
MNSLLRRVSSLISPFSCPVCSHKVDYYEPLFENYSLLLQASYDLSSRPFQTLHWNAYCCPCCGATDRDRQMALYLATRSTELSAGKRMLDIAPSPPLSTHIRTNYQDIAYRTADLRASHVDDNVDITDMAIYEEEAFDCLLCSHVLEHVPDDRSAISELFRVLKPGGWGLIMVPIDLSLKETLEVSVEPGDESARWRLYGQGDHVRMYSEAGFLDRLREAGFEVNRVTCHDLGEEVCWQSGISLPSALFAVKRP